MRNIKPLVSMTFCFAVASSFSVTIDFELGGPPNFGGANPLREEYAAMGVHFTGPTALNGGAVLNDASWGAPAISGTDILGFNTGSTMMNGGTAAGPERIDFDFFVEEVSVWYSGSFTANSIGEIRAYDAANVEIGSQR